MLQSREQLRQTYFTAWEKHQQRQPLSGVESQIVAVLIDHPEYHTYFSQPENQSRDYPPEDNLVNPFLHLGLHIALRDQLHTNTPPGIFDVYIALLKKHQGAVLDVEHIMMDCLAEAIWEMQRSGTAPDMNIYLDKIRRLV